MHIFILGMGHVGKALSTELRSAGHRVTGSTTTDSKVTELQKLAHMLIDFPNMRVEIQGHTDSKGDDAYNQKLSMKRANVVRDAMVQRGVQANLLSVNHRGEDALLVETADGVREPANRRTEITFQ